MSDKQCFYSADCSKKADGGCLKYCYPYDLLHGPNGKGGALGLANIPKKYEGCVLANLPIETDNKKTYEVVSKYVSNVDAYVNEKALGLYLFSIPNEENRFGTGTGKTTTAITILNEYITDQIRRMVRKEKELNVDLGLFVKMSDFQNKFNEQFRGAFQQEASAQYYAFKKRMKSVSLLVLDDIALRDTTESFRTELYEIIDHRTTEDLVTIYTSNLPLEKLTESLGERIVSRIDGNSYRLAFKGRDHRKDWRL